MATGFTDTRTLTRTRDDDDDMLFVMGDNNSIYELNASTTSTRREVAGTGRYHAQVALGVSTVSIDLRPSSIVMLRQSEVPGDHSSSHDGGNGDAESERQSWWDGASASECLSCMQLAQLCVHSLVLAAVPLAVLLSAHYSDNRALPFAFSVFAALASYEFAWLAYRVALRLFLPFKLHQKQTCRDIYAQIMTYSVDLQTCAVTPLAERALRGYKTATAVLLALACGGVTLAVCLVPGLERAPVAYCVTSVSVGVFSAALAPNTPDGIALLLRFGCYFVASLNVVVTLNEQPSARSRSNREEGGGGVMREPLTLEPFALALATAALLLMNRVVTCKDAMESAVLVLLDVAGLLYISGAATVLAYFARAAATTPDDGAGGLLLALFAIAWSAELGAFAMERFLRFIDFPWNHPVAKRVSSRQNIEKLLGALGGAIAATCIVADHVDFHLATPLVIGAAAGAVLLSHVSKLFLLSLKKIARMTATGEYLAVGGGVLDRIDTVLFVAIVLCPVLEFPLS